MNAFTEQAPLGAIERRLPLSQAEICVWDRPGRKLPMLLVHGNTSAKEAFQPLMDTVALAGHRLIALDLPGCGASSNAADPPSTYTLPGLATAVMDVVQALDLHEYLLLGWSLGGHVAIEALNQGAAPLGLVLTGTPPCGPDPAEIAATFLPVPGSEAMSMEHPSAQQLSTYLNLILSPSPPSAALCAAAARADGRLRQRVFEHIFAHPESKAQRATVSEWPHPIALIQGRREPFFAAAQLDALRWGQLWRGATQWVEEAGHAPFFTAPQAYGRLLKAFADDLAAGAGV